MMRRPLSRAAAHTSSSAMPFLLLRSATARLCPTVRSITDATTERKPHMYEQFVAQENAEYIEELLAAFRTNKSSVDASWWPLLEKIEAGAAANADVTLVPEAPKVPRATPRGAAGAAAATNPSTLSSLPDGLKLAWMCQAFEAKGHLVADLDPLGMYQADLDATIPWELTPSFYGFSEADLDSKSFNVSLSADAPGLIVDGPTRMTLRQIIQQLTSIYAGKIAFEFAHVANEKARNWLRGEIQRSSSAKPDAHSVLGDVIAAERFEFLLHTKFKTHKRFGLDGGESLIPGLRALLKEHRKQSEGKGSEIRAIIGMAHRGRLNVLHNLCGKPMENILAEFEGRVPEGHTNNRGDVKYHMGYDGTFVVDAASGRAVEIHLAPNPSHLECVNPVMQGICRAMADTASSKGTGSAKTILPIVIHGDAAFAGQGVCYEHMAMADLAGYSVGGSVHIVINNQVGFTTNPVQSRSAAYCSDLAKLTGAPVIHVNGDHPEEVVRATELAARYRHLYETDIVIDMVCYRRYGHNEGDQPRFTQPLMYRKIDAHPTVLKRYGDSLAEKGAVTSEVVQQKIAEHDSVLRGAFSNFEKSTSWKKKTWSDVQPVFTPPADAEIAAASAPVDLDALPIQELLGVPPAPFAPHPIVEKVLAKRLAAYTKGSGLEWAAAEQLAFASLMKAGHSIRLSGQDVERGTFAQRHFVLHDYQTNKKVCSLQNFAASLPSKPRFTITNSLLSEFAATGFEFGYSTCRQKDIVMWEAQFGDFANGAQPIFDQFMSACECKWGQRSNLIVSLPHGFDGQGPEHSSARLERFLQMSDDTDFLPSDYPIKHPWSYEHRNRLTNIQVCYPSTPANYFHMLRRQVTRAGDIVKPLVFCFSKQFLRDPNTSTVDEMKNGAFQPVIADPRFTAEKLASSPPRKIVVCSGQLYHVLRTSKGYQEANNVALVRIEQLAPFPWEQIVQALEPYAAANPKAEIVFAQEEPKNMGPFSFVRPRLFKAVQLAGFQKRDITFVGRQTAASPATGFAFKHDAEVEAIIKGVWA